MHYRFYLVVSHQFFPVIDSRQPLDSRVTDPVISSSFSRDQLEILYTFESNLDLVYSTYRGYWKWRCSHLIRTLSALITFAFFQPRSIEELRDERSDRRSLFLPVHDETEIYMYIEFLATTFFYPVHDTAQISRMLGYLQIWYAKQ